MVTVPDNELIRRTIKSEEDDPRMPAILEDDAWSTWLREDNATPAAAKAVLKTMEGVNWQAAPEPKKPRPAKVTKPDPLELWANIFSKVIEVVRAVDAREKYTIDTLNVVPSALLQPVLDDDQSYECVCRRPPIVCPSASSNSTPCASSSP